MIRSAARFYAGSYRGLPGPVWRLALVFLANRAGTMVLPFLSLYVARELELGTAAAATVMLAFGTGSLVGSWAGGWLSSRYGAIRVCEWVLLLSGFAFLALIPLRTLTSITAGVFVASTISEAFRPAALTAMAELSPRELQVRSFALIRLAANAGMAIGPALGGILAEHGYAWLFAGDAVTCWTAAVLLYFWLHGRDLDHDATPEDAAVPDRRAWRDGPFLAVCGVVFVFALVLFQAFTTLPVYWSDVYGLTERRIGLVFGFNGLLIVALEMPLVRLFERREALGMVALGSVLLGAGFALQPLGTGLAFALLSVTVWTAGEMLGLPFANTVPMQRAGRRRSGEYMGLYTATYAAGFFVAGPVGFAVYGRFGGAVLWAAAGVAGLLLAGACLALAPAIRDRQTAA